MIADVNDQTASSKLAAELLIYLFDGQPHRLAPPMTAWLSSSRRFTAFAHTFRDKIRKKLRTMQEPERLQDLQLELETAYLLLQEKSLSVVYEPQLGQVRYPDFEVSFTTSLTFMVEVTRLQTVQKPTAAHLPSADAGTFVSERLADAVCSKLGQLLPECSNVIIAGIDSPCPALGEVQAAMLRVQQRAEQNDPLLLQQHRFRDRAGFFRLYQRLSEVIVRGPQLQADEPVLVWVNPQAKYPLPGRVRTALYHSHTL